MSLKTGRTQPLTDDELRATPVPVSGTVATGGLTNAELRASAVPVSAASLPLPSGAAQDGVDITTPTAMPAGGSGIRGWLSAIWTKLNASLAVTGTFWQATQPVSIASMPTTPVTGTFWQTTQPISGAVQFVDEVGAAYGVKHISNKPRVSAMPYLYDISEGNVSGHTRWAKIGYNPAITTSEEDVWSYGGAYVFPSSAMTIEVASDSATADADLGTILFTGTCDAGGTTTTLIDAGVDFSATATAGDILLVDKAGTTPEWGVITAAANGSLTFSGGLSSGGSCATARTYDVLDASAAKGAMAVRIEYLDASYAEKSEIIILNTNNQVSSVNTDFFRINSFRVIAVGTKATPTYSAIGNLAIRKATVASPFYSYITAGYTRARNSAYTVPAGKTLYVTQWNVGASTPNDSKVQTCRVFTRTNVEPSTGFRGAGNIFYPYTECLISNGVEPVEFTAPTRLPEKTDLKVSAIGLTGFSGPVTSALRGWLE